MIDLGMLNYRSLHRLWDDLNLSLEPDICMNLLDFVINDDETLRKISAMAVTAAINQYPDQVEIVIKHVLGLYDKHLIVSSVCI